jgi:hypothetical protein
MPTSCRGPGAWPPSAPLYGLETTIVINASSLRASYGAMIAVTNTRLVGSDRILVSAPSNSAPRGHVCLSTQLFWWPRSMT